MLFFWELAAMFRGCKRIVFTKDRRKQKDFFEKEKLKSKMRVRRQSPHKQSVISLDLLNLHVVNQISIKKNHSDRVQKPVYVDINEIPGRWRNVELPKTPEHKRPKPFPDDARKRLQKEVLENRRKYLSEKENVRFQNGSWSDSHGSLCNEKLCHGNLQPANSIQEEPWLSEAAHKQRNFSDPEADMPFALHFQNLNRQPFLSPPSPEYSNSFRESPIVTAGKDLENGNRREPWFGIMHDREALDATQDAQPIAAALFEEENHPFLSTPSSESYHSFSNKNIINQSFIHSIDDNQTSSMYGLCDVKEMPPLSSCAERRPAERELESIFTVPEQIYSQNTQSFSTLDQEPIKNQLNDYCVQDRNPVILSAQQEDATISEGAGVFTSQQKNIKTMQNYLNKSRKGALAEANLNHLHIFGLEETEEEVSSNYSQSSNPARENDDASQLSSQSPSYSPEQTEKCASTTSDESAEEDQDGDMSSYYKNYIPRNDGNRLAVLGSRRSCCSCHSMDMMTFIHHDYGTRDGANVCPQLKPAVDLKKYDRALPPQITSHASFKTTHTNSKASRHAWSQTEKCVWERETSDAAVQCDLIQACRCKNEISSVHSAEIVTSTSKVETTGGQNIPADRAASQSSSTISAMLVTGLPSATESLRQRSRMSRGTLVK